jgi:hypothetical protein
LRKTDLPSLVRFTSQCEKFSGVGFKTAGIKNAHWHLLPKKFESYAADKELGKMMQNFNNIKPAAAALARELVWSPVINAKARIGSLYPTSTISPSG